MVIVNIKNVSKIENYSTNRMYCVMVITHDHLINTRE